MERKSRTGNLCGRCTANDLNICTVGVTYRHDAPAMIHHYAARHSSANAVRRAVEPFSHDSCFTLGRMRSGTNPLAIECSTSSVVYNRDPCPERAMMRRRNHDRAAAAGQPVDQPAPDADHESTEPEKQAAGTEGDIERHDFIPRWWWRVMGATRSAGS